MMFRPIALHFERRRLCLIFIIASISTASTYSAVEASNQTFLEQEQPAVLEPGKSIERELGGGQEHIYQIKLEEGQYARIVVEQRGIDVDLYLEETGGKIILHFDDEYRGQGEEIAEMVAEASASYRFIVSASLINSSAATYKISFAEIRPATRNDRLMHEARRFKADHVARLVAGKYEESRQLLERALAISENILGKESPFVAQLLDYLAFRYYDKQDFAKAMSLGERALAISEKTLGVEHTQTLEASRTLSLIYVSTNQIAKAERLIERIVEISQRTLGPEHFFIARCLMLQASVKSDRKESEQLLKRALTIAENALGPESYVVADVLNELGVVYTEQGDYQQAEQLLLRSQTLDEKLYGPDAIQQVVNLHNLGRIAREKKDYAKAEEYYRKAISIVEKAYGPENPRLAIILNNIANIYRARGEYDKSLESHLRVLRISETTRGPYHPLTLLSLGNIAKAYAAKGSIAEAIKFQSRVDAVIERNIEMNLVIGSERQKLSYLTSIAERTDRTISLNRDLAPNDATASALAVLALLQRKGRVLDAMSESFLSLRQRATPEEQALLKEYNDVTSQLARLVLNGPQSISFEDHQKMIGELGEQKERLEGEVSRRSAQFRAGLQPVTLAAIQAAIPASAALIEFAVYRPFDPKAESNSEAYKEPRYIAYVIRHTGEVLWRDLGDAKMIDEAIGALRQALRNPLRRDARDRARAVDERVMRPVRTLIGDAKQLLISPDGELNLVPIEALVDEQGRYLIQNYSFTYLTSGRDLLRLQVTRKAQNASLVIADPLFGEPALPQLAMAGNADASSADKKSKSVTNATDLSNFYFAPLSSTAQEARAIKSLFPEINTLMGPQATESSLKLNQSPLILHIATHGFFLTDEPASSVKNTRAINASARIENPLLRSGLALAGANLHRSTGDDGIMTAMEASGLNLWGTKLVTLSACDTGLGEVKNGEGVYGLRRAIVLAGAETLVMSLWPVSDYVTREMMTAYYTGLRQGQGRGEALRQVQLGMLKRKGREHPFYWASFIQSGEWANLDGKR
jgi:CHAT domain-containing protein/Tfp pilus assembly protein PilF